MRELFYKLIMPIAMAMVGWISLTVLYGVIINIGSLYNQDVFMRFLVSPASFFIGIGIFIAGILFARFYVLKREKYSKPFHILAIVEYGGLLGIVVAQTFVDYQLIHVTVIPLIIISIFLLLYRKYSVR